MPEMPSLPPAMLDEVSTIVRPAAEAPKALAVAAIATFAEMDDRFVDFVADALGDNGVHVFVMRDLMQVGEIAAQTLSAINAADVQIVFCTKASDKSEWCQAEAAYGRKKNKKQVPIFIDPIESLSHWTDWFAHKHAIDISGIKDKEAAEIVIAESLPKFIQV